MILIEDDLLFIGVPKCASISMHQALEESDYNIKPTFDESCIINHNRKINNIHFFKNAYKPTNKIKIHIHATVSQSYDYLKRKPPFFCIHRDYCKRFISAANFIFNHWFPIGFPELESKLYKVDNDFLYKTFDNSFVNDLKVIGFPDNNSLSTDYDIRFENLTDKVLKKLEFDFSANEEKKYNKNINWMLLDSQESYKSGYTTKFIFEIDELDKLENFLFNRYGKTIKINTLNKIPSSILKTNIVEDMKLRNWVWDNFEKYHFTKKIF